MTANQTTGKAPREQWVTVSKDTHDRIAAHAIGTLATSHCRPNQDGTVAILLATDTIEKLREFNEDTELAIRSLLGVKPL